MRTSQNLHSFPLIFLTLLGHLVLTGWNYKSTHIIRVHMQSESHKCDLDKIKVQALTEHFNTQYHGEIEKMYFRELDRQMIKKKERERGE